MEKPDKAVAVLELATTIVMSIVTLAALALVLYLIAALHACSEGNCL